MSRTTRCAPLGRVWVCGRSAGRSDSCASKEPPSLAWPDNWQLRGTPCGPISSRACKPHLMTLPVLRGFGCWGVMSMCDITRADAAGAPVSSLASWTTRGEDHPTARLLDLVPGRSGTVHENWLAKRGKDFRAGVRIGGWIPSTCFAGLLCISSQLRGSFQRQLQATCNTY